MTPVAQLLQHQEARPQAPTTPSLSSSRQESLHSHTAQNRKSRAGYGRIARLAGFPQATMLLFSMLRLEAPPATLLGPASWLHMVALTQASPVNEGEATGTDEDEEEYVFPVPEGWEEDGDDGSELVFPTVPLEEGLAILSGTETQSN